MTADLGEVGGLELQGGLGADVRAHLPLSRIGMPKAVDIALSRPRGGAADGLAPASLHG
jgi:hypothetical protein